MSGFDPSVISQIPDSFDPVGSISKGFQLKDLIDQNTLNSLKIKQEKKADEQSGFLSDLSKKYDMSNPEQASKAASEASKNGYPDLTTGILKQSQSLQLGQAQADEARFQLGAQVQNKIDETVGSVLQSVQSQTTGPDGKPLTNANGTEKYDSNTKNAMTMAAVAKAKADLEGDQSLSPQAKKMALDEITKFLQQGAPTYDSVQKVYQQTQAGKAQFDKELERRKTLSGIENQEDLGKDRDLQRAETKRHNLETEKSAAAKATGDAKPPAGFEWDPDKTDTLRPVAGGPKDPNSKPWSGREKVFSERILTGANEAARAIENITELPVGASTGTLGLGASPGHSIFASGKDVLRNKLSSQDVQDYGTMLAGVRRNLGTIEATGLAPPGSLTEGMASLELRDGDTQLTKLRKLSEMRQIVDAGLEVQLADPAIPDALKGVMRSALDRIHKAVPYTQHDVTALQKAQQTKPETTLSDLIKQQGLGGSDVKPYSDSDKEARYQAWKKAHGQ